MAALGDLLYRAASLWTRLAGNTTSTRKFLSQTGTGSVSAAPAWNQVADSDLSTTNITTNNVSTSKHGFAPLLPNDASKYLDGTGAYSVPPGTGSGTVSTTGSPASGNLAKFSGSASITNGDLSGDVSTSGTLATTIGAAKVTEAMQVLADNTTQDVSTSKHGYMPKLPSGVPGVLLGKTVYTPGSEQSLTTTSATFADVDATNLVVAFTAPASGAVLVRLTAFASISTTAQNYSWGLRNGSSDIANSGGQLFSGTVGLCIMSVPISVTGLTPATAYSLKWSHAATGGATGRVLIFNGQSNRPPGIMEVWAA